MKIEKWKMKNEKIVACRWTYQDKHIFDGTKTYRCIIASAIRTRNAENVPSRILPQNIDT